MELETLTKYYKAGYDAVRRHSSSAYVVFSNRVGDIDARELFPLASGLFGSVIDVHYYNLFSSIFDDLTVQQNIDFIHTNRTNELTYVTTSNGPLTFIGTSSRKKKKKKKKKKKFKFLFCIFRLFLYIALCF